MLHSNNMKFSTLDHNNDEDGGNCAAHWGSAEWFKECFRSNLNGQYTKSEKTGAKYISWYNWKNSYISLNSIQLMIRLLPWHRNVASDREIFLLHWIKNTQISPKINISKQLINMNPLKTFDYQIIFTQWCNWMQ